MSSNSQYPLPIIEALRRNYYFHYDTTNIVGTSVSEVWSHPKFQDELKSWDFNQPSAFAQPILINAPTGSGKTTFVLDKLIPYAEKKKKSVLFLCNRHALGQQTKEALSKDTDMPALSTDVLRKKDSFYNIVVGTYQDIDGIFDRIRHNLNQQKYLIGYVVFDEVHFFTSDALFNAETDNIYRKLLYGLPNCQRIYLSATPQEVKSIIACEEFALYQWYVNQPGPSSFTPVIHPISSISEYLFQPNYSYIKLNFCDRLDDLLSKITVSKDKWLVFVSSKSDGRNFAETLKKQLKGDEIYYIDANTRTTREGDRKLSLMMKYEKFNEKVLITTSLLDNGVNFRDKELRNIIVDFVDPIQVMQMIGRKRCSDNKSGGPYDGKESVNVYIVKRSQKEIQTYLNSTRDKVKLLDFYRQNPQRFIGEKFSTLTETEHQLFQSIPGPCSGQFMLHVNEYAQYKLHCLIKHYEHLDGLMEMEGETAFEREVAGWFGIKDGNWNIINDVEIEIQKQIVDAIKAYGMQPGSTGSGEIKQLDAQLWDLHLLTRAYSP